MARTVDQNRATNEAFASSSRGSLPTPTRPIGTSLFRSAQVAAPQRHAHSTPAPGNPVPMDVDLLRKRAPLPASCFRCGKPGHFGKDCPDRFDVRALSVEELQGILEDKLAQLDVAQTEPTGSTHEESTNPEDFHQDDE
jgi:hypothetical protein